MIQTEIKIGPIRPTMGPLAKLGGAAISQASGAGSIDDRLSQAEQDIRALRDQNIAFRQLLDQQISVPMFIGSGSNHQAGVVPDPGTTAGSSRYLNENGTFTAPVPTMSRALAYNSVLQSILTTANTPLIFDTNVQNVGGIHSTTVNNSRFTAPVVGWYIALGQVSYGAGQAVGSTLRQIAIAVNGSFVTPVPINNSPPNPSNTIIPSWQVVATLQLNAGDYVEFLVYQDSGSTIDTSPTSTFGALTLLSG